MEWLALILIIVVLLVVFALLSKKTNVTSDGLAYAFNEKLFSPAERSFYGVLTQVVQSDAVIFGKVRVADILSPAKGLDKGQWRQAFNRISSKHFDYVICSRDTLSVLCVIELDDESHSKKSREQRDRFLEEACASAALTLHRVKASTAYSLPEIRSMIFPGQQTNDLVEQKRTAEQAVEEKMETSKLCPKCSSELVERIAQKGPRKGSKFLACSAYPKCRYVDAVT
jgi:hypothetical protein